MKKSLLAFLLTTSSAQAAPIPYGDFIQWYSGGSSFNFANQTFTRGGKSFTTPNVVLLHVKDGKITEAWVQPQDQYAADEFWS